VSLTVERQLWNVETGATAPYTTRILVRRPADPADANGLVGVVGVEWLNVSGGQDADPDFGFLYPEILARGSTWVGVSRSSAASTAPAWASRSRGHRHGPISAYINAAHPLADILVHSRFGAAPLSADADLPEVVRFRTDLADPILWFQTETDVAHTTQRGRGTTQAWFESRPARTSRCCRFHNVVRFGRSCPVSALAAGRCGTRVATARVRASGSVAGKATSTWNERGVGCVINTSALLPQRRRERSWPISRPSSASTDDRAVVRRCYRE